ncbi:MAG TPA: DUF3108 domain-containing protein [Bryobacteraceae bacterium]|nr:DUF3108 domain-containing protein [Bryobacteraceae bacterium]
MKTIALFFVHLGLYAQIAPVTPKKSAAAAEIAKASQAPAPEVKANKSETLHYNVNWPSGLSLGEADLTHSVGDSGVTSTFRMDASVPGFAISENVSSRATSQYCSIELKKQGVRGKRKIDERTEFDAKKLTATRSTEGGGKSELSTPACAKDALAFVQFVRRELAAGRLPAQQKVYYGGAYGVHVTFAGTQQISVAGESVDTDKLTATIKGPVTQVTADLFFAKDTARTLVLVQVPLAVGKFSMELAR